MPAAPSAIDHHLMRAALAAGRRGLGGTWPNPSVGCVIAHGDRIVAVATTAPGGRPHAETQALSMAGAASRGATAYVSLEPCSHHGQTPPCTTALIEAGIARVVFAAPDPDERVNGAGLAALRAAGVEVFPGILREEAEHDLAGFLTRIRLGRPLITLKLASSMDGRIATASGASQWITGTPARKEAHALRGRHDSTMVGVGTVLADDPDLTCRIAGYAHRPTVRIVADSHLRTPLTARIVATASESPTWLVHREGADPARLDGFRQAGVTCIAVAGAESGVDPALALQALGEAGLTGMLVEGGAQLAASLLRRDLVDRIAWFQAPALMGADGTPAVQALGVADMAELKRFHRVASRPVGDDLLSEYSRV